MRTWLEVLLAIWIAFRINQRHERLWAGNMLIAQRNRWELTVQGAPIAPALPSNNRHVLVEDRR